MTTTSNGTGASVENRIPPHSLEAEAAVISAALCGDQLARMVAMLRPEDFYSESHRRIFEACVALHVGGNVPDVVQVANWLRNTARLEQVGGMAYLTEVLNAAPVAANAVAYASIVRAKARCRATIQAAHVIASEGYAATGADGDYLSRSAATMTAATRLPDAEALESNAETLRTIVMNIQRAATTGSMVTGLPTGLDCYDRMTLGLHGKQLTVIAARPGVGKTAIGGNIGANVARTGVGVLFFSLEMSREEIISRQLASLGRIDGTHLKTGRLTPTGWERLHAAAKTVADMPLWIDDRTGLTVADITNTALGAIDQAAARKSALGCIVVDYLQKISVPEKDRRKQRYEQVGDIVAGLKQLARDTGMPVIALAQLRRLGKGEKGKRPTMDDLRESGDTEAEADVVTLLHAPDDEDDRAQGKTRELIIEKARGGRTGVVRVAWRPELTLFENLPEGIGGGR